MTWENKMIKLIEGVLNRDVSSSVDYKVIVVDNHNVRVEHPLEPTSYHESLYELSGHWKETGVKIIHQITERAIADYIKEKKL